VAKTEVSVDTKKLMALLSIGGPKVLKTTAQALYKEGAAIFEESQDEVPIDTNALRTSGQLGFPTIEGKNVVVEISYGGAAVDYAMIVHEDLEAQRKHGKKAKYLEDPARRRLKGMDERLLATVRKAMGI
jgi:hypothetical protein